ncbi:MAG: PAS domain S-box protein [Candidatus Latescibacteria bacterium]|nr:PAS domain S-box protein [Candidatus Latescibacterota bacterium]
MFNTFNGMHSRWLNKASEITAAALRLAQEGVEKTQADERIRLILESTPDSMVITNAQGEIIMTNAMAEKTFGYERGDLMGQPVTDLIPDRFHGGHDGYVSRFAMKPHSREMGKGLDFFAIRKDGSEFPVEISLNPIETPDELLIVAAVRDITEHKAEQARLRKLSRATEQSPALVVITDRDGIIEYVNPKFTEVTGYTFEEAVGQTPRMLKSGRQSDAFYKNLWDTVLAGEEWHGEFCNRRKNGEEYWERASVSPIRDDKGEVSHFVAVKEDITERAEMHDAS